MEICGKWPFPLVRLLLLLALCPIDSSIDNQLIDREQAGARRSYDCNSKRPVYRNMHHSPRPTILPRGHTIHPRGSPGTETGVPRADTRWLWRLKRHRDPRLCSLSSAGHEIPQAQIRLCMNHALRIMPRCCLQPWGRSAVPEEPRPQGSHGHGVRWHVPGGIL